MLLLLFLLSIFCGFNIQEISRKVVIIIIVLFGFSVLPIQATEMISEACDRALYEIYDLRTITAQRIIDEERDRDPGSLFPEYLENWKEPG